MKSLERWEKKSGKCGEHKNEWIMHMSDKEVRMYMKNEDVNDMTYCMKRPGAVAPQEKSLVPCNFIS